MRYAFPPYGLPLHPLRGDRAGVSDRMQFPNRTLLGYTVIFITLKWDIRFKVKNLPAFEAILLIADGGGVF
jgi:hypothetical protein